MADAVTTVTGDLFGSSFGLMVAANSTTMTSPVMTMAAFNAQRYEPAFAAVKVATPPKKFPVVDRCIGGDSDWNDWASCVRALSSLVSAANVRGLFCDCAVTAR